MSCTLSCTLSEICRFVQLNSIVIRLNEISWRISHISFKLLSNFPSQIYILHSNRAALVFPYFGLVLILANNKDLRCSKKMLSIKLKREIMHTNKNFFIFRSSSRCLSTLEKYNWVENSGNNVAGLKSTLFKAI